jgi:hypothetical protein
MDDYICPICKLPLEVIVRAYREEPFLDGRFYEEICHRCSCVPRRVVYDKKTDDWIWFDHVSPDRIATVEDLIGDGWEKHEAEASIRAVKKLLRNPKTIIVPEGGVHIFESLVLEVSL